MPRVAKVKLAKVANGVGVDKKVPAPARRKKNLYNRPESIPQGEVLTDIAKKQWKIGPSIGAGGFGEIYSACKVLDSPKNLDDYDHVVKVEPHENGPLFVEQHFYMRNAKLEDINGFCKKKKLKTIGMPYLIGSGSHEINGIKHRFIVIPRYGKDVWNYFLLNNRKLPEHTIYRLAIQMLDVLEYIHGCGYVHADLKGTNILLGFGKAPSQAYLVDFGLASHYTTKDYKPDPKKMHNGTIEYTSRDAHNGIPTMRGDIEILGYNLIHWTGVLLPWEASNFTDNLVQKEKEEFMKNTDKAFEKLSKNVPAPIKEFFKYLSSMKFSDTPDYEKCKKIFQAGLKSLGKTNSGELDFKIIGSKNSSDDFVKELTPRKKTIKKTTPLKRHKIDKNDEIDEAANTPPKKLKTEPKVKEKIKVTKEETPKIKGSNISISRSPKKYGKTIINDNTTPNATSTKTYEVNFEVECSLDANVVINVTRKKKPKTESNGTPPKVNIKTKTDSSPKKSPRQKRTKK